MAEIPTKLLALAKSHTLRRYPQGSTVLYQGEVPQQAYLVSSGIVKINDIGSSGDEKIISFLRKAEMFPLGWVSQSAPVALYYYTAFTDIEVYAIPRKDIVNLLNKDKEVLLDMFTNLVSYNVGTTIQITALEQSKGVEKIVYTLQYLLLRFGKKTANRQWEKIDLRLTHQDIASMTGLTRETTSTELGKLRKRGVLTYKDQHYLVNVKVLQGLLSSDEFTQATGI